MLFILKSSHVSESIPSLSGLQRAHHPSSAGPHRWQAGRRDLGHRGELESTRELFGFAGRETNCLTNVSRGTCHRSFELTLQNIETDTAEAVDVGVVNLGQEADLWGRHGIIVGEKQLKSKDATCKDQCQTDSGKHSVVHTLIWRLRRTVNGDIEVAEVIFVWDSIDARNPTHRDRSYQYNFDLRKIVESLRLRH